MNLDGRTGIKVELSEGQMNYYGIRSGQWRKRWDVMWTSMCEEDSIAQISKNRNFTEVN